MVGFRQSRFLLIVPAIAALYLLKRKVEDVEVPSTLLWQRTLQSWEAVRPWEKLQRNLLLLLQLLAAILLVLALVRPAVPMAGAIAEHTILVVDTSGSMLAREGGQTRFQRAVAEAEKAVENLGSGQAVTLIEAGREPKVWLSKSTEKEKVLQALYSLAPRPGETDRRAALSLAGAIASTEEGSGVMWFGDGGEKICTSRGRAPLQRFPFRGRSVSMLPAAPRKTWLSALSSHRPEAKARKACCASTITGRNRKRQYLDLRA